MFKRYQSSLLSISFVAAGLVACGDDGNGNPPPEDASQRDGQVQPPRDGSPVPTDAPGPGQPDAYVADCEPVSGTELSTEIIAQAPDIEGPVFVTSPPGDARLFVVEKCGRIKIIDDGKVTEQPFLDIGNQAQNPDHQRVDCSGSEEGLLGLAFHPDYSSNGRFFVNYIEQPGGESTRNTVVAQYQVTNDQAAADPGSEKRVIVFAQPRSNHNAGMLAFGPDGYLYIGTGDGGGADDPDGVGQDVTAILGSMLRIDVDGGDPYAIPASNPHAGSANGPGDPRPEIWAKGLRNPWRYSFDRLTGDLYIADVGQREWEEINVQPASSQGGENYGWNVFEGTHCFPEGTTGCDATGMTMPVAEYEHDDLGTGREDRSVTGGYVYRGQCIPDIQGWYFYADYSSGRIRVFEYASGQAQDNRILDVDFGEDIVSFGEDAAGELYVVNFDGQIRRLVPAQP